ncbi:hypothetical protein DPMN_028311 [Dreissena polymorpha]|uniref:Uncharacterized protein n=1 Tax=Dreissena polymorpha TaxID=45954 RepID=A0A9D4LX26_DREPO|nr:hypothetical protein DPMN_028311 [Dreissena polymorpha]
MSWLGYGPEIRQARGNAIREFCTLMTARFSRAETIISTGSKDKGLSCSVESGFGSNACTL